MSQRRVAARIGKPHGLRGEVTVQLHTDEPERRLAVGATLATEAPEGSGVPGVLTVRSTRVHQGIWLVGFEGVPDRSGAEGLRGTRLLVEDTTGDASVEEEDTYAEATLLGLAALDVSGVVLGEVCGLDLGGAQDRLRVRLPDGREALVPFVSALVPEVDLAGGRVVLDLPPGLLDLGE